MSTASVQRQVDRRIYRLWRWQISGRRRTRREGVPRRKTPSITTVPSIILAPKEASAPPSSTCMNGTAPHPTWKALRTLKSSFWISMITTCWSPSTRSWGHRLSPSVSHQNSRACITVPLPPVFHPDSLMFVEDVTSFGRSIDRKSLVSIDCLLCLHNHNMGVTLDDALKPTVHSIELIDTVCFLLCYWSSGAHLVLGLAAAGAERHSND